MSEPHPDSREQQVNQVIAEYLKAVEAGQRPDRGELLRRHADLAGELRSFFADQDAVLPVSNLATVGPTTPSAPSPVLVRYFGDYELLEEIARGGMGIVFRARQVTLDRVIALKMILAGQLASAADVERFRLEAQAAATLDHPNILPIHEVGEHEGQQYFSMKLVEGGSLAALMPQLSEQPGRAVEILRQVAEAVHHAHQRGILHRDLKPANVLLDADGTPYVSDFGLAKRVQGDSGLTQSGAIVGTPSYMAPEQARGAKDLSVAVDVYSLGAILYEALTGQPPFRGATPLDTVLAVLEQEPPRPGRVRPGVDRDLETICLKCLDKDPARRYASAAELAGDLGRWQSGEPIQARRYSTWERAVKWARRRPAVAALTVALLLLSLAGLAVTAWGYQEALAARQAALDRAEHEERARQEADDLRRKEGLALQQAERNLYDQQIALAGQAWQAGNVPVLLDLLDRCPARHRGWEWGYLRRLAHGDLATFPVAGVDRLAFSPDGRLLALAESEEVQIVHALTGKLVRRLTTPWGLVSALAFSPDGRRLAAGGQGVDPAVSGGARIWDLETGKQVLTLEGQSGVAALAFHPDGRLLAGGCQGRPVQLWDARTGKVARTLPGESVADLCFAPGGRRLASVGPGQLYFWDLDTGQTVFESAKGDRAFRHVAISPDGTLLAVDRLDHRIQLVDAKTGRPTQTLTGHIGPISSLVFSPDGRRLYSSAEDRTIHAWRVRDGSVRAVLRGHKEGVDALALSPDGRLLVSAGGEQVKLWDATREDSEARTLLSRDTLLLLNEDVGGARRRWVFSTDGERFTTSTGDGRLVTWQTRSGAEEATRHGCEGTVSDWEFSPDGRTVALLVSPVDTPPQDGLERHHLLLIDVASGRPVLALEKARVSEASLAFSGDGQLLAAPSGTAVKVWSVATGRLRHTLGGHSTSVQHLAISPDRRWLVSTSGESDSVRLQVWDLTTGQARWKLPLKGSPALVAQPAFSPDGRWLVTPRDARTVQVWDLQRGEAGTTIPCPEEEHLTRMTFAPGGTLALAWSNVVTLWDPASGKRLHELRGHGQSVAALAFSPDGRRLVSSVELPNLALLESDPRRGEIILWDVETGRQLLTLDGHGEVGFSADGQMLVSMVSGLNLRLWDARPVRGDESALRLAGWQKGARAWHEARAQDGKEGTIHHLDCLLRLEPGNAARLEQRARAYLSREPARAVEDLSRALKKEPTATRYAWRGRAYHRLKQPDKALADLTEAIRRGDDLPLTIRDRGRAWLARGEPRRALADFTFALALAPDDADTLPDRAEALAALGRWRDAEHDLARSLAVDDRDARRWSGRCLVLLAGGREKLGRQLAGRMGRRFARSERPEDMQEVLLVGVCLPGSMPAETLLRVALRLGQEESLAGLPPAERAQRLLLVGAGLYRAGVPGLALPRLRQAQRLRGKEATGVEALLLAGVLAALGQQAEARTAGEQGARMLAGARRLDWRQGVLGGSLLQQARRNTQSER